MPSAHPIGMNPTEESEYVHRILRLIEDGLREGDSSRPPPGPAALRSEAEEQSARLANQRSQGHDTTARALTHADPCLPAA